MTISMFDVPRSARAFMMVAAVFAGAGAGPAAALDLAETPGLEDAVASGVLPPVRERVPSEPRIIAMKGKDQRPGRHGGKLNTLIDKAKSVRYFVVWGYARLVGYTPDLELRPDILKDVKIEDNRVFTMTLRKGHKWSDGAAFTTEDFRYYWEDIANNGELKPAGPLASLLVDGKPPKVDIIDEVTVRYSWDSPNPTFLELLARSAPPFIYRPAHYLKQFHKKYGDAAKIEAAVRDARVRNWASLHNRKDQMNKNTNADMPTLQPWMNTTSYSKTRFVLRRNPYFHRVDPAGKQLPYIDEIIATVAASKLIPAKAVAGETDLQARSLSFANIAILKHGEKTAGYRTLLWPIAKASNLALYPNLNTNDPVWRRLLRSTQFRRALSLGIDRKLVNRTLFLGLGRETGNSVLNQSPLYNAALSVRWAQYDPELANSILDGLGLDKRGSDGYRLLPDGRRAEIVVETAGEKQDEIEMLQLMSATWKKLGLKLFSKPSQRDVLRERSYIGETVMTVSSGWDNGIPSPRMSPVELAPTQQDNLAWPKWGQHYETKGRSGEAPDLPAARRLLELYHDWLRADDDGRRTEIWNDMLKIHADESYVIGVVSGVRQPVVVSGKLRNVPEEGIYGWDPGSQFGIHRPDQFWIDN